MAKLTNEVSDTLKSVLEMKNSLNEFFNGLLSIDISINIILNYLKVKDPVLFDEVERKVLKNLSKQGINVENKWSKL